MFSLKQIFVVSSLFITLLLANPLPETRVLARDSDSAAVSLETRGDPIGLCFLRSMQTTLNRFRGSTQVDITQALDNIRGNDPGRLGWETMAGNPTLSWRAWRTQVVGANGRIWRGMIQVRNSGSRAARLTIEQPEGVGTRYIPVDVPGENIVTQEPSITCTMIDNLREGVYILRDL